MNQLEIPPLFTSDGQTKLIFEPKDGKIVVSYANWEQNKVALAGEALLDCPAYGTKCDCRLGAFTIVIG